VQGVLTSIAEAVRTADGVAAVQVVVAGSTADPAWMLGEAGFVAGAGFSDRLRECRERGARLVSYDAAEPRQRLLPDRRTRMLADGAWRPLHGYIQQLEWRDYAATPIPVRGSGGAINCYLAPGAGVSEGLMRFFRAMAEVAAAAVAPALDAAAEASARIERLTSREREVLELVRIGCSNAELAERLGMRERTARTHMSRILGKLEVASRTQAALLANRLPIGPAGS